MMYQQFFLALLQWICLVLTIGGSIYLVLCPFAVFRFRTRKEKTSRLSFSRWPPVTILKPVCGVEKEQKVNLRSACLQDYPKFQTVFSVQDPDDPVIPLLKEIEREFGPEKVSVVIDHCQAGPNFKINNLLAALPHALYDFLVISDSDVYLNSDYLKTIIAPLADPEVGFVCTLYKAKSANRWFEKMELLTLNADFIPSVIFAYVSRASKFCLGCSVALRRDSLKEIGGLTSLSDYLAEDYEMGRHLWASGKRMVLVPYIVDITIDLKDFSQWWNHQVCWDQKTRAAKPAGFFASIVTRSYPFALLFAVSRMGDTLGVAILIGVLGLRLATAAVVMAWGLGGREGVKSLALLPLRDIAGLVSWALAFTKKRVIWRRSEFILTRDGRLRSL
ncbi:MAG TPA: bacteriohopanetetrol glucosamine biosynthesis glycosyltransferase HpnI [Thermodesulfobacteriota bacterium]|jgi:ceramide glucosyltransferase|nr:bacteriohopanetetrol glucosamine biosynthesis glycosyltransferase HpnI [Thermodesulfobacteriota bacterium]